MSNHDDLRGTSTSTGGDAPALSETATKIGSQVTEGAVEGVRNAQAKASESMHSFAEAIRKAGDELKENDQGPVAQVLAQAAGSLDEMSRALGQKGIGEIVNDVRSFGRQHPGAFILGSALLGVALGRFAQTAAASGTSNNSGERRAAEYSGNQNYASSYPSATTSASSTTTNTDTKDWSKP